MPLDPRLHDPQHLPRGTAEGPRAPGLLRPAHVPHPVPPWSQPAAPRPHQSNLQPLHQADLETHSQVDLKAHLEASLSKAIAFLSTSGSISILLAKSLLSSYFFSYRFVATQSNIVIGIRALMIHIPYFWKHFWWFGIWSLFVIRPSDSNVTLHLSWSTTLVWIHASRSTLFTQAFWQTPQWPRIILCPPLFPPVIIITHV